jgi:hypothetical protein
MRLDQSKLSVGPRGVPGEPPLRSENVFRKEGEYWTIAYNGTILRLRDTKGLRYLARLLRQPGERVTARELMQQPEIGKPGSGAGIQEPETRDQKPFSDERARLAVTKRIKSVIRKIEEQYPALGYKLRVSVKTGAHCVYLPDPERPIVWTA